MINFMSPEYPHYFSEVGFSSSFHYRILSQLHHLPFHDKLIDCVSQCLHPVLPYLIHSFSRVLETLINIVSSSLPTREGSYVKNK